MGLLSAIVNDGSQVEESEEFVGGVGAKKFTASGNHIMIINMAKMKESDGGAIAVSLELEAETGEKVYEDMWITTKEKKPYYINKEGIKRDLPSFTQVKGLNFLLNGIWGPPEGEMKQVKEYDWTNKKEVFKDREVITSWIGKPIGVCVQLTQEDSFKDASIPFTRISASHYFDPVTNLFSSEKKAGKTEPENHAKFAKVAEEQPVADKRKLSAGATATTANAVDKKELGF